MSRGEHRVRCRECGSYFNCGDCIPMTCNDCNDKATQLRKAGYFAEPYLLFGFRYVSPLSKETMFLKEAFAEILAHYTPQEPCTIKECPVCAYIANEQKTVIGKFRQKFAATEGADHIWVQRWKEE